MEIITKKGFKEMLDYFDSLREDWIIVNDSPDGFNDYISWVAEGLTWQDIMNKISSTSVEKSTNN
jgi:hypothetical protein